MALFHFHVGQIKQSARQSIVTFAAYRAGEKLYSEYYGEVSDYTHKPYRGTVQLNGSVGSDPLPSGRTAGLPPLRPLRGRTAAAALAKVLLLEPDILLLDEPTKELDAEFKQAFAEILQTLLRQGVTILMVSHDIEFCAWYAHRCALFFDGSIVIDAAPREFFSGNSFYTTSANRMARGLIPEAVTAEDVITACSGELPPEPELPEDAAPLLEPAADSKNAAPGPLPWWRKMGAAISGGVARIWFLQFMGITDLTNLIGWEDMTGLAWRQLRQYAAFLVSLFIFAVSISRKGHRLDYLVQTPTEKRKLSNLKIILTYYITGFSMDMAVPLVRGRVHAGEAGPHQGQVWVGGIRIFHRPLVPVEMMYSFSL